MNSDNVSKTRKWEAPMFNELLFLAIVMRAPDGLPIKVICSQIRCGDRGLSLSAGTATASRLVSFGYLRRLRIDTGVKKRGRPAYTYFVTPEGQEYARFYCNLILKVLEPALVALRNARPDGLGVRSTT